METLLASLGVKVLGDVISKIVMGGMKWAKDRPKPNADIVELKLSSIAEKVLPAGIPNDVRKSAIESLVQIAKPTFEDIVRYSPNTARVISVAKKAVAKKAVAKKAVAKKAVAKKAAAKKISAKRVGAKKFSHR